MASEQKFFIITSYGLAATVWLAAALNKHPAIFCAHHYTRPPKGAEESDGTVEMFAEKRNLYGNYPAEVEVATFLEEHRAVTDKPFVGNVHAYRINTLHPRLTGALSSIPVFNLTRHPVTRMASTVAHWLKHGQADSYMEELLVTGWQNTEPHMREFIYKHKIDTKVKENRLFLLACREMLTIANQDEYAKQHDIPQLTYETITADRKIIRNLIDEITNATVEADDVYLDAVFSDNKRINANLEKPLTAKEQYEQWGQWQRAAFASAFRAVGDKRMSYIYDSLGYDFSFMNFWL